MVGPRESSVAQLAVERLVAGMFTPVPCQLVAASEAPAAVVPAADVRLLPGVGPEVGFQVRGFGVLLAAPRVLACVRRSLALQHYHHLRVVCRRLLEHLGKLVRGQLLVGLTRGGRG